MNRFKRMMESMRPQMQAKWDSSPDVRAEFGGDFERYLCYSTAVALGDAQVTHGIVGHA